VFVGLVELKPNKKLNDERRAWKKNQLKKHKKIMNQFGLTQLTHDWGSEIEITPHKKSEKITKLKTQ